jgi:hypothetical protein
LPLISDWTTFFSAELTALASLTGFVVVAISINLSRILSFPHLPTRAGEALIGPVGAITATSLVLLPEQPAMLLGAEIILIGLFMAVVPALFQARAWPVRKDAWERTMRAVSTTVFSLAFVVGGALLFEGARSSLYWIAAGDILVVVAVMLSAWVLMVEILR